MPKRIAVKLILYTSLRYTGKLDIQTEEAETIADVLEEVARKVPELAKLGEVAREKSLLYLLNDHMAKLDSPVADGDKLSIVDPFLGG